MLEQIDLSLKLRRSEFDKQLEKLGPRLLELQRKCKEARIPILIIFDGWDAAGKDSAINRLLRIIDPRGCRAYSFAGEVDNTQSRPLLWKYIVRVPHRGYTVLFIDSWYGEVVNLKAEEGLSTDKVAEAYEDIAAFERRLADDGYLVIKFWYHISKKEQKHRFQKIAADPLESWRIGPQQMRRHKRYRFHLDAVEEMLQKTSITASPWTIVEAEDKHFARLKTFETIAKAMENELARHAARRDLKPARRKPDVKKYKTDVAESEAFLRRYDLSKNLTPGKYERRLSQMQDRMLRAHNLMHMHQVPACVVFEGWDASGKGGAVKRLLAPLDPARFEVITIAAPTAEEKDHHYLWRFWKRIPRAGRLAIFDRSWYGRVLVERIEGFCTEDEWKRAYQEINEFERMLVRAGIAVVKLWMHIDKDEQLRRFEEREKTPAKRWKITKEDWRNRKKWEDYEVAVSEMLLKTSTTYAPWSVIESNDKHYARVRVIETVAGALDAKMEEEIARSTDAGATAAPKRTKRS